MHVTKSRNKATNGIVTTTSKQIVEDHAITSAIIAFTFGLGTGLLATAMLQESNNSQRRSMSQRLGQQLLDAMNGLIPNH